MTAENEDRDVFQSHCFEPFPEPQTIPSGWDTSGFLSTPQTDSDTDQDAAAEVESH